VPPPRHPRSRHASTLHSGAKGEATGNAKKEKMDSRSESGMTGIGEGTKEPSELENKRRAGRRKEKGNYFFLFPIPMIL